MVNDSVLACPTPPLQLPAEEQSGNYPIEVRIGFVFDGYEEYKEVDEEKHGIKPITSFVDLQHASSIVKEQQWVEYNQAAEEPILLKVCGMNYSS